MVNSVQTSKNDDAAGSFGSNEIDMRFTLMYSELASICETIQTNQHLEACKKLKRLSQGKKEMNYKCARQSSVQKLIHDQFMKQIGFGYLTRLRELHYAIPQTRL